MKLRYYEKVIVRPNAKSSIHIGKIGFVFGISEDEEKVYRYYVIFPAGGTSVEFRPEELEGTGEFVDRSEIYSDADRIRVRVVNDEGFLDERANAKR